MFPELIVNICNIDESQRTFWIDGIWDNLKKGTSYSCTWASFQILGKEFEKVYFLQNFKHIYNFAGNVLTPNSEKLLCSKADVFKISLNVCPNETLAFFTRIFKNGLLSRGDLEIMGNVILESQMFGQIIEKMTSHSIIMCYDFFTEIIRQNRGVLDSLLSHGLSSHIDMVYRFQNKEKDKELSIAFDNLIKQIDLI